MKRLPALTMILCATAFAQAPITSSGSTMSYVYLLNSDKQWVPVALDMSAQVGGLFKLTPFTGAPCPYTKPTSPACYRMELAVQLDPSLKIDTTSGASKLTVDWTKAPTPVTTTSSAGVSITGEIGGTPQPAPRIDARRFTVPLGNSGSSLMVFRNGSHQEPDRDYVYRDVTVPTSLDTFGNPLTFKYDHSEVEFKADVPTTDRVFLRWDNTIIVKQTAQ